MIRAPLNNGKNGSEIRRLPPASGGIDHCRLRATFCSTVAAVEATTAGPEIWHAQAWRLQ